MIQTIAPKTKEGQAIALRMEECVDFIQERLVEFARCITLLLEDNELMRAAGWNNKEEMYADPVVKRGLSYAMSIESEWQIYRLENMLKVDAALPDANILETPNWTDITQSEKMRELKGVVADETLSYNEKVEAAREIVSRPKAEKETEESHTIEFNPSTQMVSVDGVPAIQFDTKDSNKVFRVLSRLIHDTDKLSVSRDNQLEAWGANGKESVGKVVAKDQDLQLWIMKRLRARRSLD